MQEMQKTWVRSLSQEDHLEEEMATHSSVLAWRIPGMGLHRVGHDWSDLAAGVVQLFSKCVFSCSVVSNSFAAPWTHSLPGSSLHRIFQARILQWVAFPSPGNLHLPRDWTRVSFTGRQIFFYCRIIREALLSTSVKNVGKDTGV